MNKLFFCCLLLMAACSNPRVTTPHKDVVLLDPALNQIIDSTTTLEILDTGYQWVEGPVWVKDSGYLLFSDVKQNTIFKYVPNKGVSVFLHPSGYTGTTHYSDEPGSNGLLINQQGELVACEHGDRRLSTMSLATKAKRTLAKAYNSVPFNSPNDVVQKSNGDYYFTDPPYGMPGQISTNPLGVYRLAIDGKLTLLLNDLTPNGLAFSPDEHWLYINQSLASKAYIMRYAVLPDGTLGKGSIFYDATAMAAAGLPGLPDGLKTDVHGNVFSTGPGGVLILSPDGKLLGRIDTGQPTANCGWGGDGSVLYITANDRLCRIQTKTSGVGF